ncbi:MAG TPA: RhuM family protein [Hyphomicrobiaceae bacterium]|nr:RhuM family protein [Hyphomicrobiaceae bacterium]
MIYMPAMSTNAMSRSTGIVPRADNAIYMAPSGELQLDVRIDSETVWLTQAQMAELFGSSQRMMSHHINNVFSEGELDRENNIQKMYIDRSKKPVTQHSLDVIISVGYRVKSPNGIHFRQWATRILRERLIGAHRQRQLEQGRLEALGALASNVLTQEEARALLSIIGRFSSSWQMLRQYDENQLPERPAAPTRRVKRLTARQAHAAVATLKAELMQKGEASDLFGREHSDGLAGILGNIEQTFGGKALYPSVEERAAALLYFVIKNHPFTDGNKRIGSLLFVHFLEKNGCLSRPDGSQRFDANALVAVALLVAESDPKQKSLVMRLIMAMLS